MLRVVCTHAKKVGGEIEIGIAEHAITFRLVDRCTYSSGLIEGTFPNWRQLMPDTYENTLTVDPDTFLAALVSVGMLARESSPVKIELNGVVKLIASSPDLGTSAMELTTATWDGPDMVAAFNPQYLGDALKISRGGKLHIRDGLTPALVEGDVTSLVMPVRLPTHIG